MARTQWVSYADESGKGLKWVPVVWPDSHDVIQAASALDLVPVGGDPVNPIPPEGDPSGLFEHERARHGLLQLLVEDLSKIVVVGTPEAVFIIAPPDDGQMRAMLEMAARWRGEPVGGAGIAPPPLFPWTAWAITPRELLDEIQYHLLEPTIDGGRTWQFWSATAVDTWVRERAARWLMETRLVRQRQVVDITATVHTYTLDPTLASLLRVYRAGLLARASKWELDHMEPGWESEAPGSPRSFHETTTGTIRFAPAPATSADASYVFVPNSPTEGLGDFIFQTLSVPATFSWGIKYGVMADMLSREGEGNDPTRAEYCEQRFDDSVALARLMMGERLG